jgi:hypothetical protein
LNCTIAAIVAVIRQNKHHETAMHVLDKEEDPYSILSKFPSEHDRIIDVVVEKLMLDGCKFSIFTFGPDIYIQER